MEKVQVFSPASVANVACGYDIFGFALNGIGDYLELQKRSDDQLVITEVEGATLPMAPEKNVATVAIKSLLQEIGSKQGFDIKIRKEVIPGSGLGSSASSSAGAVFAANSLLGSPLSKMELVKHAMEGEALASQKPHADNIAPALLGGFTVVRSCEPEVDIFNVSYPEELNVLIIFPQIEVKTAEAKRLLGDTVSLDKARIQWGNVAGLVAGLSTGDWKLIGRSLEDVIAEPARKVLIPQYDNIKAMAMQSGAVGFNISGSGPSMFSLYREQKDLDQLKSEISDQYKSLGIECIFHQSTINSAGTVVV